MAFIPIDAKADVNGSKKGKLTPAQHAQINAWCLTNKTGILDCLDRCISTASVYTATQNTAKVIFKKGYIVVCGRIIECEENSEVLILTPTTSGVTERGWIVARYDLSATGASEFKVVQKKESEGLLIQQDLNDYPLNGVFELPLYVYSATSEQVILEPRTSKYVPNVEDRFTQFEESLTDEGKPLGGYDTSKGTIEERLTKLGFKEGSVTLSRGNATVNKINRQGNYCLLNLKVDNISFTASEDYPNSDQFVVGKIKDFLPKEEIISYARLTYSGINETSGGFCTVYCSVDGTITAKNILNLNKYYRVVKTIEIKNLGYEAIPI